jgi:hypothetical protein
MAKSSVTQVESVNGGLYKLENKGLSDKIETLCDNFAATTENPETILDEFGWITEYVINIGSNRPRLDGYKNGVGIEHEAREQMNVRSHLLWMEAAYQQEKSENGLDSSATGLDAGIFIIPTDAGGASVDRTKRELEDEIFTRHFQIECPIVLVEYDG